MVVLTARIEAHVPERRELVQALLEWATVARREAGALGSHVYEDLEVPAVFCVVSQWGSRKALEAHVCSPKFGVVLGALELLARPALVAITEAGADDAEGGDALQTLRRLRSSARGATQPGLVAGGNPRAGEGL